MDPEQRALAVKTAIGGVRSTYAAAARPCAKCRFGPLDGSGQGKCEHFAHWQIGAEPLTGKNRLHIRVTTAEARGEDGLCGPEGLLFEPYSLPRKLALWLSVNSEWLPFLGMWAVIGALFLIGGLVTLWE